MPPAKVGGIRLSEEYVKTILLLLAIMLVLTGCDVLFPPSVETTAYPSDVNGTGAYPGPAGARLPSNLPTRTPLPKPSANTGTVSGRIIQASTGGPLQGPAIYLADVAPMTPGPDYLITIQQNSSPHVLMDRDGYFALMNLKPGTYGLVIWSPIQSAIVPDPTKNLKELLVTVKPGEITDVGELVVDWS